ncbi:hypothetical protein EVAR_38827_1 [Eumeta japonica]|uniref:Uncharacterized protein n=1 Tax=Eumeta variegata TaxID=151549 RepID=A0A4C1XPR7_EUMVA|nr:hypothetical protein EVAR_38827_1 [Eumeta japonica]
MIIGLISCGGRPSVASEMEGSTPLIYQNISGRDLIDAISSVRSLVPNGRSRAGSYCSLPKLFSQLCFSVQVAALLSSATFPPSRLRVRRAAGRHTLLY